MTDQTKTSPELPAVAGNAPVAALRADSLSSVRVFGIAIAYIGIGSLTIYAPAAMLVAGNGAWVAALIVIAVLVLIVPTVTYFARRYVVTGSLMSYLTEAVSPTAGRIAGASSVLMGIVSCGLSGVYTLVFVQGFVLDLGQTWMNAPLVQLLVCTAVVCALGVISYYGAASSARIALILTVLCIPFVLILLAAVALQGRAPLGPQLGLQGASFALVLAAVPVGLAPMAGFEGFTSLASETRNAKRAIPRILLTVVVIVGVFLLFSVLTSVPALLQDSDLLAAGVSPSSILADAVGMPWLKLPLDATLALGAFAGYVGCFNDTSRIIATAGREGVLPRWVAGISPRRHTPARALLVLSVLAVLIPALPVLFAQQSPLAILIALTPTTIYLWLIPMLMAMIGLAVVARRDASAPPALVAVGVLGALAVAAVMVLGYVFTTDPLALTSQTLGIAAFVVLATIAVVRSRRHAD